MMQQYERIKSEHTDAILFFRLGDFYEMFRGDAIEASRILGLTLTQRQGTPMCGVPHHSSKTYISRLLEAGKKVAVCEQTGAVTAGKGITDRQVVQILSPGTLLDEEYLSRTENNFLISISRIGSKKDRQEEIGFSLCDISTGDLILKQCESSELLAEIQSQIARWHPRELLIQESLVEDHRELAFFLRDHPEMLINRFADWHYDVVQTHKRLCSSMGILSLKSFGIDDDDPRIVPVSAILTYAENALRHDLAQLRSISVVNSKQELNLDQTSIRNLELVRNLQDGGRNFSLLAIVDNSRTAMGSRLVKRWLLSPLQNVRDIDVRLDRVEYLYRHQSVLASVREQLGPILDIHRLLNRVLLDRAHPKDLLALGKSLSSVITLGKSLPPDFPFLLLDESQKAQIQDCADLLVRAIDEEAPVNHVNGGVIKAGFDPKVDELRNLLENSETIMESYVSEERVRSGIANLKLRSNNIIGYYLEVTKSNISNVPANFLRKQSLVNGERFTTERLSELENDLSHALELSVDREKEIFLSIRTGIKPFAKTLLDIADRIAELDALASFSWLATTRAYVRPKLFDDKRLHIRAGRHPVVEAVHGNTQFIPNDLDLAHSGQSTTTALITGPNMAGKSTFLRQSALIVLLAHIGSFVPADSAEIGLVDSIFCRVGASDNLARGESTFLVEMNETAFILKNSSPASLVIMDEVGRGTSTQDGLSIAQAVLEHIVHTIGCRCLFATHFHELTEIQATNLSNLSMAVDDRGGRVEFLRRVQTGPSSNSYGIHVAQLAGMPGPVIARAQQVLLNLVSHYGQTDRGLATAQNDDDVLTTTGSGNPADKRDTSVESRMPGLQVSLFSPEDEVFNEIRGMNLDSMTPLKALNMISEWQKKLS